MAEPVEPVVDDDDMRAADGRVPGRRGRATRQKLLEQTSEMLRTSSYRDLKVVDIARGAGTSPATFYQYFADVEAAILVLAEELALEGGEFAVLVQQGSWKGKQAYPTALAVADSVLAFWEEHRAVLRVIDLATDEGDGRFHQIRVRMLNPLTNALVEVVEDQRKTSRHPADLDPMATAGVLVSMLAHVAAHQYGFEFWGIRTDDLRRSMARVLYSTVTGQRPPAE